MATSDQPLSPRDEARAAIREFLSTRRARITPAQAGLPTHGGDRRRVAGLRREEVAVLAGVSPQYYVRLERGDATGISDGIIDGVAEALQLDTAERAHLIDLLRTAGTPRRARRKSTPSPQPVRPTIQRLLDAMHDTPAVVMSGRLDIIAANPLGRALFSPLFDDQDGPPNNARYIFLNEQSMMPPADAVHHVDSDTGLGNASSETQLLDRARATQAIRRARAMADENSRACVAAHLGLHGA